VRILSLSAELPYPPNHGIRLRTWHLLSRVARDHDVTVMTWSPDPADGRVATTVAAAVSDLVVLPTHAISLAVAARLRRTARFVAGGLPPFVQAMFEARDLPALRAAVLDRHAQSPFDVIVAEEEAMGCLPVDDLGVPIVVHRLNVFTRVLADERTDLRSRVVRAVDLPAWRRFDRTASATAAIQIATTPESADDLRVLTTAPVRVITNGVAVPPEAHDPAAGVDVAYVGWMGYAPNAQAVQWFARDVLPAVRHSSPATTFRIVGRLPTAEVMALAGEGVLVTGEVDDVVTACRGVRVGVAPLLAGMGIKNKTLELMAMGLPVVSLPRGAEGIAAGADNGLIVVDGAGAFARAVTDLLADPDRCRTLGARARRFVIEHFGWDAIAREYGTLLDDVARNHGAPREVIR